eukprot:CAMPEP_0168326448 /NCGR_PEP_ID=MMETSP0213-20121227/5300_1 /TAXON_ID=151035 /ORGANISM="Euplotes harpa, Strain FSP1.4" /LENGTH=81 /DNA_ID=CAMNT_0008329147 /DNA_START=181 /DNA_END=423 /DNA_ORIENTATION=-
MQKNVDIQVAHEFPSRVDPNGKKVLDKHLQIQLEEFINEFKNNSQVLNLSVFKKFIIDHIFEEKEDETSGENGDIVSFRNN